MNVLHLILDLLDKGEGMATLSEIRQIPRCRKRVTEAIGRAVESGLVERVVQLTPTGRAELESLRRKQTRSRDTVRARSRRPGMVNVDTECAFPVLTDDDILRIRTEAASVEKIG